MSDVETFDEWRVTGQSAGDYPPYDFTWSPDRNPHLGDPEAAARAFVALIATRGDWTDGPHLYSRTVMRTAWTQESARSDTPVNPA